MSNGNNLSSTRLEGRMVVDECEILTEDQLRKARLLVAGRAENASEAGELMRMLGIHPSQDGTAYLTALPASNIPTSGSGFADTRVPSTPPRMLRATAADTWVNRFGRTL